MRKRNLFYGLLILPMIFMASLSSSNGVSKQEDTTNKMTEIRKAVENEQSVLVDNAYVYSQLTVQGNGGSEYKGFTSEQEVAISATNDFIKIVDDGFNAYPAQVRNYKNQNETYYIYLDNSSSATSGGLGSAINIIPSNDYLITGIDVKFRSGNLPENGSIMILSEGVIKVDGGSTEGTSTYNFEDGSNEVTIGAKQIAKGPVLIIDELTIRYIAVNSVVLTFDTGCHVIVEEQVFIVGKNQTTVRPENPTRPNEGNIKYTFDDWYVDKEFSEKFVFGSTISEDTTVYAKWIEEKITGFTVSFNLMGGEGEVINQVVEEGKTAAEPLEKPTKATDSRYSYEFAAWCVDESYSALYDFSTPVNNDITLYAYYDYHIAGYEGEEIRGLKNEDFSVIEKEEDGNEYFTRDVYNKHMTIDSAILNENIADSTFTVASTREETYANAGIASTDGYDIRIRYAHLTWEIKDYSKYIDTVRLEIKNTEYNNYGQGVVNLYKDSVTEENHVDVSARPDQDPMMLPTNKPDSDTIVQMLGNTDETVRKVVFTETKGRAFGWENIRYILKDASVEQQCLNFANDFLNTITCDGIGSVTSSKDAWNAIGEKVNKYFDENVLNALKEHPNTLGDKVAEALERYDLIVSKYGESEYVDFLNRVSSTSLNGFNPFSNNDNLTIIIITISVIMMVTTVMFYIRRRRVINK